MIVFDNDQSNGIILNKNKQRCQNLIPRSPPTLLLSYEPGRSAHKTQPQTGVFTTVQWVPGTVGSTCKGQKLGGFNQTSEIFEEDNKPRSGHENATAKAQPFAS